MTLLHSGYALKKAGASVHESELDAHRPVPCRFIFAAVSPDAAFLLLPQEAPCVKAWFFAEAEGSGRNVLTSAADHAMQALQKN